MEIALIREFTNSYKEIGNNVDWRKRGSISADESKKLNDFKRNRNFHFVFLCLFILLTCVRIFVEDYQNLFVILSFLSLIISVNCVNKISIMIDDDICRKLEKNKNDN